MATAFSIRKLTTSPCPGRGLIVRIRPLSRGAAPVPVVKSPDVAVIVSVGTGELVPERADPWKDRDSPYLSARMFSQNVPVMIEPLLPDDDPRSNAISD